MTPPLHLESELVLLTPLLGLGLLLSNNITILMYLYIHQRTTTMMLHVIAYKTCAPLKPSDIKILTLSIALVSPAPDPLQPGSVRIGIG